MLINLGGWERTLSKRMVWRKSQRWESTRWNGRGGSEEAHLARLGVLLWRKVGIEAETVRMSVLFLPGQVSPHRAPSATARDNWYPTLNICLKMQALFVRRICFFHLPEVFDSSYSMITYWDWHKFTTMYKAQGSQLDALWWPRGEGELRRRGHM